METVEGCIILIRDSIDKKKISKKFQCRENRSEQLKTLKVFIFRLLGSQNFFLPRRNLSDVSFDV